MVEIQRDIFDEIFEESDIFDEASKSDIFDETADISSIVKIEIGKIKPLKQIIERIIEKPIIKTIPSPVVVPPKEIVKETIIREIEKKDNKKYAEEKSIEALKEEILQLKEILPFLHGGSGVIGLPQPEGNNGKSLQVVNNQPKWVSIGLPSGTFTISNNTPIYTFDPTNSTVDDLYQIVATLIRKLQGEI